MKKDTTESFIEKARNVHGDKYDYSKTTYINSRTKLLITCPEHGDFYQKAHDHIIRKYGCPKCGFIASADKRKKNNEKFINEARKKWGDIFDYSEVEYVSNSTKVCIKDKEGNRYWQTPANHLYGFDCRIIRFENTDDFIISAKRKFGNKYDYSKVNYTGLHNEICIICPKHGEFLTTPANHLYSKYGCPKCSIDMRYEDKKYTNDEFINLARSIHGDKYDYSKVDYENYHTKVCIICHEKDIFGQEHGEFWQTPSIHLNNHGCPKCSGRIKTEQEYIEQAKKIHNNRFDYSKTRYINNHTKICIICPEHGEFWQMPNNHLRGYECPVCNKNRHVSERKLYEKLCDAFPNIEITHSYKNKNLLGRQELDIFFPYYSIGIEYQGAQHFFPVDFGGKGKEFANDRFKYISQCDKKKYELCKKNNIHLLYFTDIKDKTTFLNEKLYTDFNELKQTITETLIKYEKE